MLTIIKKYKSLIIKVIMPLLYIIIGYIIAQPIISQIVDKIIYNSESPGKLIIAAIIAIIVVSIALGMVIASTIVFKQSSIQQKAETKDPNQQELKFENTKSPAPLPPLNNKLAQRRAEYQQNNRHRNTNTNNNEIEIT